MKKILFALSGMLMLLSASAQKFPFPQNVDYEYGYQSASLDANNALAEYENWKSKYYKTCSDTEARIVDFQNGTEITVSEGIGYGMLIFAYMGDKDAFVKLWTYYKNRRNARGLMNWRYADCNTLTGENGATDADLDVAMALLVGTFQWPDEGTLKQDLDTLLLNIMNYEFATSISGVLYQKKGDFGSSSCVNPSYFAPGYYRAFSKYLLTRSQNEQAKLWMQAVDGAYYTILRNANKKTGLVYAWTDIYGKVPPKTCTAAVSGGGSAIDYQFDACRTPWRMTVDYLWWGEAKSKLVLSKLVNFVKSPATDNGGWYGAGGISSVVSGYYNNGLKYSSITTVPFTGGFALAGMSESQETADEFLGHFSNMKGDNYFNSSMAVLYKLLASGNFWNPFAQKDCLYPSLGRDLSLCNLSDKTISVSGVDLTNDKVSWLVNGIPVSNSGLTLLADSAAFYTVERTSGTCTTRATIAVIDEVPQPSLPAFSSLCSSNEVVLNIGAGYTDQFKYYWTYEGEIIPGENKSTLHADLEGVYKVYVYNDNCASKYARTYIPSTISKVDKPFNIISAGQSITVSASTATNVEWYSDAAGTNKIGSGKSLTVTPTASSTYYMKDLSSTCALSPVKVYLKSDCGDMDGDGVNDCDDECPLDAAKAAKGKCGCNVAETCVDCNGVAFGTAKLDVCEICSGGTTGRTAVTDVAKCIVDEQPVYLNPFVEISPIPTKSDFVFTNKAGMPVDVTVYSCSGNSLAAFALPASESATIGSDFAKGMYLVDVNANGTVQSFKIVKE